MSAVSILGFDSAWTDDPRAPGAICTLRIDAAGRRAFVAPTLATFDAALGLVAAEARVSPVRIVALDQPTLVPNATGSRPADRVAASLIGWLGGGVQPANRGMHGRFDDAAPVWRFKAGLAAIEDPEAARTARAGLYLMEVYPALALPSLDPAFCGRGLGPRYNPARRRTFALCAWRAVLAAVRRRAEDEAVAGLADWAEALARVAAPRKADQDRLDAVLCALIGLHWRTRPRTHSIMIGDRSAGYTIAPAIPEVRARLVRAAASVGVPVDPDRPVGETVS